MASLRTAVRRSILGALIGGAPACWDGNPGFMLKDSETGSVGPTTHVTGVTVTSEGPTTTTTTSEATSTSVGPATSGSETSTSTTEALTTLMETTGSGEWEFPTNCKEEERLPTEWADAAADTFFVNEITQTACSLLTRSKVDCLDSEFSKADRFPLFYKEIGPGFQDDSISAFAVRFASPSFIFEDDNGKIKIPLEAFVAMEVKVNFFHGDPEVPWIAETTFAALRVKKGDLWAEGDGADFSRCLMPAASFRCRVCPENSDNKLCKKPWSMADQAIPDPFIPFATWMIGAKPEAQGTQMTIKGLFKEDLEWLTVEGLMVFPTTETAVGMIEVNSREHEDMATRPGLRAYYCPPTYTPP